MSEGEEPPSPSARVCKIPNGLKIYPHAALAQTVETSDAATWGTASSSVGESTTEPDPDGLDDLESMFSDDGEFTVGPIAPMEELIHDTDTGEADEEKDTHVPDPQHPGSEPEGPTPEEVSGGRPSDSPEAVIVKDDIEPDLEDQDDGRVRVRGYSRRRRRDRVPPLLARFLISRVLPAWCAMVATDATANQVEGIHIESNQMEAMQQVAGPEPGKSIVPPDEVRRAVGPDLDAWIMAAQVEHDTFMDKDAVQAATAEEIANYGKKPLPMLNVWSRTDKDFRKCRSCIAGNFQQLDPAAQRWTAQAEPSSIFAAAKLAAMRGWRVSKLDVKGAFLNAPLPEGELILVQPPAQWVTWGIVPKGVVWKLNRAVYGLRQSPKWWSDERDAHLSKLTWEVGNDTVYLEQNAADSQVWCFRRRGHPAELHGLLCVYVDDFLIMVKEGPGREQFIKAITNLWEFGKERVLSPESPFTFLGLDWIQRPDGGIYLVQERFTKELLEKYGMAQCKPAKSVSLDRPPMKEDIPTPDQLRELQAYAGAFNWLATRTRPDVSYYTSLLASSASKQATWSKELAHKILRYLAGTASQGRLLTSEGSEGDLRVYTDAGFAGAATQSQNGLVICWGGSIVTWRSSRAALSALSTAEAELCAAALGWQVTEGVRYLLSTLQIYPDNVEVMIDNQAALTAASLGATWRTRYYAVRPRRLLEEGQQGRAVLKHCPTKQMVADALTKLATPDVLQVLIDAMEGRLPGTVIAHTTSVSPGLQNRGDIAGDGPDRDNQRYPRHRPRESKECKPWNVPGTGTAHGKTGANVI